MRISLFLTCLVFCSLCPRLYGQQALEASVLTLALGPDSMPQQIVDEPNLYSQRWDTLPQIRFWRQVMSLTPDSAVLNVAATREVLEVFETLSYDTLTESQKQVWKREKCTTYGLPLTTRLYVTYGKDDYYQFEAAMTSVDRGISIFQEQGCDPWLAQAILLIESPGQIRTSPTGANGAFQLMKSVALEEGLVVNSRLDEREDFDKAAAAAARFLNRVCIPETRSMLARQGLSYDETEVWFRLMVLHVYHAGAGNVGGALRRISPSEGGMELITQLWRTRYRGFGNASQNYSQVALAACLELDALVQRMCTGTCTGMLPIEPIEWRTFESQ